MKRSRAIYLITVALKELGLTNSPDYDVYEDPELDQGEKLLNIIEKSIGMKPPSYQISHNRKGIGGAVAATRVDGQWEPEDGE